jgi:hypothetical protein
MIVRPAQVLTRTSSLKSWAVTIPSIYLLQLTFLKTPYPRVLTRLGLEVGEYPFKHLLTYMGTSQFKLTKVKVMQFFRIDEDEDWEDEDFDDEEEEEEEEEEES